jgi:hypothetical protein
MVADSGTGCLFFIRSIYSMHLLIRWARGNHARDLL